MAIRIRESKRRLTAQRLTDLETKLSVKLPKEYRDFLVAHNGGFPEPSVFWATNEKGQETNSCVDRFLAVYNGEYDNFESYFDTYKLHQVRLPEELVPVAHDPGGNLICIAVSGPHRGAVYFWDHEDEAGNGEQPGYDNVYLIAGSFAAFLDGLSDE